MNILQLVGGQHGLFQLTRYLNVLERARAIGLSRMSTRFETREPCRLHFSTFLVSVLESPVLFWWQGRWLSTITVANVAVTSDEARPEVIRMNSFAVTVTQVEGSSGPYLFLHASDLFLHKGVDKTP